MRTVFTSLEHALVECEGFTGHPDSLLRAVVAVEAVIRLDNTQCPIFYLTFGRNFVGVLGDDGQRIARVNGLKVRARHCAEGFSQRIPVPGKSLPDDNLPFGLTLS